MFDVVGVLVLTATATLFAWLAWRAWRATHKAIKWVGAVLSGVVTLVFLVALGAALVGFAKLNRTYDNPVPQLSIEVTEERVARGARFGRFCAACHAADTTPPMEGRDFMAEGGAPPIGTIYAPNLTPTHLADWTDGEIVRAIREGIHRSGRSLLIMPSRALRNLSDEDVHAIVAFLRSQPPVDPDTPPTKLNVLGAIMINLFPALEAQPPVTEPITAPPIGPTAEYGGYVASYLCTFCHGADLRGDETFESPGLAGAGRGWTQEQFIRLFRSGVRPDGSPVDNDLMPWRDIGEFLTDDDELRAIHAHLATLGG